jgi:predicted nucleotidyltransferase
MKVIPKNEEKAIKDVVFRFINPDEYKIFIFGSRATGKAGKFSDYDVGIMGKKPVAWETISFIKEAFEESDLPFRVDVVDFFSVSNKFRKIALSKIKKL